MMNVLLRVSNWIDEIRARAGRHVFWLILLALLAGAVVLPLLLYEDPNAVALRQPPQFSQGDLRRAPEAEPAPAPVAPPPAVAKAPAPAAAAAPAPAPAPAAKAAPAVPPAPAAKPAPADKPLVLSDSRVAPPPQAAASAPADAGAPAADAQPRFQLQLGAFADEARARRLAQQSSEAGFPASVLRVTFRKGRVLHRVRTDAILTRDEADALRALVKERLPALDPIVVARRPPGER